MALFTMGATIYKCFTSWTSCSADHSWPNPAKLMSVLTIWTVGDKPHINSRQLKLSDIILFSEFDT